MRPNHALEPAAQTVCVRAAAQREAVRHNHGQGAAFRPTVVRRSRSQREKPEGK